MAIKTVNDCVGPCNPCIGCRRGRKRKAVICDSCGQEIDNNVYLADGKHLCEECVLQAIESVDVEYLIDD